ncbi:MAG: hypothetical protein AAF799_41030 [Myxococcota bacterium]
MLGRFLRVARPDDWTGLSSRVVIGVAFVLLAIVVVLVRIPPAWSALVGGQVIVVRLALIVAVVAVLAMARAILIARLPRAAVLAGRRVRFHDGTRRRAVAIDEIAALHVEQRPPPLHEVFVIERRDGAEHDLCPTHWWGAPALHRTLGRKLTALRRRRAREQAKARRAKGRAAKKAKVARAGSTVAAPEPKKP